MAIKTTIQFRRDTLANWQSANPTLSAGEIALVDLNNGVGAKKWVVRVGDGTTTFNNLPETAYALSSNVSALGDGVLEDAKEYTDTVSAALTADYTERVNTVSSALTAETQARTTADTTISNALTAETQARTTADTTISNALTAEVDTRTKEIEALSAEISAKVRVENVPSDYINISRVDAETYHSIVAGGTADPKTIYIVSSDNLNAFGGRVTNVGDATDLSDAVNLKQLNALETSLTTTISSISADLAGQIDSIESGAEELVSSVSATLTGTINTVSSTLTGTINTVSSDLTGRIDTLNTNLTGVINTVSSDLTGRVDAVSTVVDTLSGDLYALSGTVTDMTTDLEVGVSALGRTDDTFKYAILQGGVSKGEIEVPYDVFVDSGEVKKIGDETYLLLTLNNAASTVLSIEATDLIDVYTGKSTSTISVGVDGYEIAASVIDGSIVANKLASDSVTTVKIVDGNVTTDKLGADAVTNAKLADNAVQSENILSSAVTTVKIADANVTTAKLADDSVTNDKVADNAIASAQLSSSAVTTEKISDAAITPAKMDTDQVFVFDCGGAAG